MTIFIQEAPGEVLTEENTLSECIRTVAATCLLSFTTVQMRSELRMNGSRKIPVRAE